MGFFYLGGKYSMFLGLIVELMVTSECAEAVFNEAREANLVPRLYVTRIFEDTLRFTEGNLSYCRK